MITTHSTPTSLLDVQIAEAAQRAAQVIESEGEARQAPAPPRQPFASVRGLTVTWALCLGLTLVNVERGGLFTPAPSDPEPARLVAGLEISAAMDGRLVEAYLAENGVLPVSLADVGLPQPDPDLAYERFEDQGYSIRVSYGGYVGVFDSRREAERRAALAAARAEAESRLAAEQAAWAQEAEQWLEDAARDLSRSGVADADGVDTDTLYGGSAADAGYPPYSEESFR